MRNSIEKVKVGGSSLLFPGVDDQKKLLQLLSSNFRITYEIVRSHLQGGIRFYMQQQVMKKAPASAFPRRRDIFFHFIKTGKLIGALFTDPRVPLTRKVLFLATVAALVLVLFFPDAIGEVGLSAILPIVGTVVGVPIDAGFDWTAFALLAVNLLHVFPAHLVAEHYNDIFRNR
jgi:hypothetical protein